MFKIIMIALVMAAALALPGSALAKSDKAQGPKVETPKTVVGSLIAVDTAAGTVTVETKRTGAVATTVTSTTPIVDSEGNVLTLSDFTVGEKVKVQGVFNKNTTTFTTVKQVKNLSLPTVTPTP